MSSANDGAAQLSSSSTAEEIATAVGCLGSPVRAEHALRFFKTGPGEYGEGDVFVGVRVPVLRTVGKRLRGLELDTVEALLHNDVHEVRQLALFVAVFEAQRAGDRRPEWVELYRRAVRGGRVINWDLVDCSADPLLGAWLLAQNDHRELAEWASNDDLWRRRVGIIGTFAFLKAGHPEALVDIAPLVIADRRDLIQKAFGWMLREMGKRVDEDLLLEYLETNAAQMGRTALSYAVERLTPAQRTHFRSLPH